MLGRAEEIIISLIETGDIPQKYGSEAKKSEVIMDVVREMNSRIQDWVNKLAQRELTRGDSYSLKYMLLQDLITLTGVLGDDLQSDAIDAAAQEVASKGAVAGAAATFGAQTAWALLASAAVGVAGIGATVYQMFEDDEEKQQIAALLDSIFKGRRLSRIKKIDRLRLFGKRHIWKSKNNIVTQPVLAECKNMNKNRIFEEYFRQNNKEKFEETPFGQIVVDEINQAVNDLPEIKLAADTLSEQETQDLGRQVARTVLQQVRAKMVETLPEMVEEILDQVMSEMDR